ncbi:MAG: hypothetical protein SPL02_03180 [Bacilli bacterium]|nr:hypothetical protein [Bacilli bacterium]MDY6430901.1 hypothetical protein [Bacilli bacterium]
MNEQRKNRLLIVCFILMALLGATLGLSIASFCLSLNKNDKLLSVMSYFTLILFILVLVLLIFFYMQYQNERMKLLSAGKEKENEEEK